MTELEDQRAIEPGWLSSTAIKQCCAAVYDSDAAKLLLGDSLHPGGTALTERLGAMLNLGPRMRVLDVAAGRGTSALTLAARFGCEVTGLDYSRRNIEAAKRAAGERGLSRAVSFYCGDAERLPLRTARSTQSFASARCAPSQTNSLRPQNLRACSARAAGSG